MFSNPYPQVRTLELTNYRCVITSNVAKRGLDVAKHSAESGSVPEETVPGMAEAIERRRKARRLAPSDFARASGLTMQGLAPVRSGVRKGYQEKVRSGVAKALAWPLDWYERLLAGDDPETFPDTEHPDRPRSVDDRLSAVEADVADLRQTLARVERGISELRPSTRPPAAPKP